MNILYGYILTFLYIFSILFAVSYLKRVIKVESIVFRKLIHIFVGFSWFIMQYFFKDSYHLLIPPLAFVFFNYLSYKKNLISCMENNQQSKGTIYYALSFLVLAFITVLNSEFLPFYGLGVLTMALADGIAPFVGFKFSKFKIGNSQKTYVGSLSVIFISLMLILVFNKIYYLELTLLKMIIISFLAGVLEFLDYKHSDNLTLPIGVSVISYLLTF